MVERDLGLFSPHTVGLAHLYYVSPADWLNPAAKYEKQNWMEVSRDVIRSAAPAPVQSTPGATPYLHWVVPAEWHTLDLRLFDAFRWRCSVSGRVPLVVECLGPETAVPREIEGQYKRLDALTHAIEGLWEVAWRGVAVSDRPGLVILRVDGVMPIAADVRALRPALSALSCERVISAPAIMRSHEIARVQRPRADSVSQVLQALRQQGLLAPIEPRTRPPTYQALPATVYEDFLRRHPSVLRPASKVLRLVPNPRRPTRLAESATMEYLNWARLHARLREEGLSTIDLIARTRD